MYLKAEEIIEWVEEYNNSGAPLKGKNLEMFIKELHYKIDQMDYSVDKGTTIIGYSGESNGEFDRRADGFLLINRREAPHFLR